ncbi:MAG: prenyltransferase [Candidatus Omnitrophica bacterium]|nr:prenyltransferase [Candidatus Omnitrophota bacterium]
MLQIKPNLASSHKYKAAEKYIRALRIPFITASLIPFFSGTLLQTGSIDYLKFALGLLAVIATHLGANLMNDYSDSKSGADWHDQKFYGFFGGSKLIQENVLSEKFYLKTAKVCMFIACFAVIGLSVRGSDLKIIGLFLGILFLGISYSYGPLKFSYRCLGEIVVFILFGPAIVMGAYFIQTNIFPTLAGFFLSLPFAFLIAGILIANEVPDLPEDLKAAKFNLVSLVGVKKAYLLYYGVMGLGFCFVLVNILINTLSLVSLSVFLLIPLIGKAGVLLKNSYEDKAKLVNSSKLTIIAQTVIGLIIVLDQLLSR